MVKTTGNLVITKKGQELMAKLIAGTSTAIFTKICTSSYDYAGMDLELLTELMDIRQAALVSKVTRISVAQVEVLAAINNNELESGYYVRGIGLYAKDIDDNEILYGISVESEHPDYMPAFEGKTVSGISYKLNTKVDNSEQVLIEVNPAATPTIAQVEEITITMKEIIEQIKGKANKTIIKTVTLEAAGWTGDELPYSYTISIEEVTEDNNIEVTYPVAPTQEVYEQLTSAGLCGGSQSAGSMTLLAYGDKPTMDLPVTIFVKGD